MKTLFRLLILCSLFTNVKAQDLAGGELFYEYVGRSSTSINKYKFTLRLFRECNSTGDPLGQQTTIGIYNNISTTLTKTATLRLSGPIRQIAFTPSTIPCLANGVEACYEVAEYIDTIDVPIQGAGITAAWFACCRQSGIANILDTTTGAAYFARVPGSMQQVNNNNSARFVIKDTVVVCAGRDLNIDFSAYDIDGDTMTYEFTEALTPDALNNGGFTNYYYINMVPYKSNFSGQSPMGSLIKIDPYTGFISGKAPENPGNYIVNVTVTESRGGFAIGSHNKDFLVKVKYCDIIEAVLKPNYATCDDFTFQFANEAPNPLIQSYHWDFGSGGVTSSEATPSFTYPDTGTYRVKLVVTGNAGCVDSVYTNVHVFPLFKPAFSVTKACQDSIVSFADNTLSSFGNITSYYWNFGDTSTLADTSHLANPFYSFGNFAGTQKVQLKVTNSKGCEDSISQLVNIIKNPSGSLAFRDTVICKTDTLQIAMAGQGTYAWTPAYHILQANTNAPLVYPDTSTTYFVSTSFGDCSYHDSLKIKVLDFITVRVSNDTTICLNDTIQLNSYSEGKSYRWMPSAGLSNPLINNPKVSPTVNTNYIVEARLGHCLSTDSVQVKVAPYAIANAGADTSVCYGSVVQLHAAMFGNSYTWTNTRTLQNATTLSPIAQPVSSSAYILNVFGAPGCPKVVRDTVVVNVIAPTKVVAGNDTIVMQGQSFQLHASATGNNAMYQWNPTTGLSDPNIINPVLLAGWPADQLRYVLKVTTMEGCQGEDDIRISVFKNLPEIYVPSAFTPNGDGKNDLIKAIPVGIRQFKSFNIYNRNGQVVFATYNPNVGWDGRKNGAEQPPGTYVYHASGTDINGQIVSRKGTIVLLR